MLRPQTLAVALAALTFAAAQKSNFTIDPSEVTAGTRGMRADPVEMCHLTCRPLTPS